MTIDPGLATGWALWRGTTLVDCGLDDPRRSELHVVNPPGEYVGDVIVDAWIEAPVIYPRSKARPADIMNLCRQAGEWFGTYRTLGVEAHYVEPAEWKGQVPKDIHHARVWAVLSDDERSVVTTAGNGVAPSKRHNILDAVGLGLWVAKRLAR